MNNNLTSQVFDVVANALEIKPEVLDRHTAFGDIPEWDSMGHMEIMLALEERFGIEVDADTIAALTSISQILAYLKELPNASYNHYA